MRFTRENLEKKSIYIRLIVKNLPIYQSLKKYTYRLFHPLTKVDPKPLHLNFLKNNIEKKKNSFQDPPSHPDYFSYLSKNNERIYGSYDEWYSDFYYAQRKKKRANARDAVSKIKKCNSVHKGSKYILNKPGYILEVKNVNKWFCNSSDKSFTQVLHNINLDIKEGEFVVILGHSGSGKSTLLNVLSGIDRPSNGRIVVASHNLMALKEKELTRFRRENLSFIFQQYALIPELSVKDNIMQGAVLQENVQKRLDLDELVAFLGIKEHLHKKPNQLSGGQQQRVAIVKSVIKNPKILFADEPTAAVDESTSKSILKIFSDINKRYNTTIVLITHNPIISKMGTKLVHIEKGRIVKLHNQIPLPLDELPWTGDQ